MLNLTTLHQAADQLAGHHPPFAAVIQRHGPPPHFTRAPGFPTLIHIILEQQVSLASALAAFNRLQAACGAGLSPPAFLQFDDAALKEIGFSRQKTRYGRLLAEAITTGDLDLDQLPLLDDDAARACLTALTGIGPWTADIYLMMALRRADIWPAGDLALKIALQELFTLPQRPSTAEMHELAAPWRPHRTTAAHLLWHHYLQTR